MRICDASPEFVQQVVVVVVVVVDVDKLPNFVDVMILGSNKYFRFVC